NAALADIKPPAVPELFGREDYGSTLRDAAALVTLASETGGSRPVVTAALQKVEQARAASSYTSTQESAWLVLAARALAKDATGVSLDVAGEPSRKGSLYRSVKAADLTQPLKVT